MYSGTVFTQAADPAPDLSLPSACWAFYDRVDGATPAGAIAEALSLSNAEVFAVVQQLRTHGLIGEVVHSYAAYQDSAYRDRLDAGPASAEDSSSDEARSIAASPPAGSDGAASEEPTTADLDLSTQQLEKRTLHLSSLWSWLKSATDNVKDYKNVQAFVLMEASDALERIGVESLDDLDALDRCDDPAVIRAFEKAVANNANERIPDQCYQ